MHELEPESEEMDEEPKEKTIGEMGGMSERSDKEVYKEVDER